MTVLTNMAFLTMDKQCLEVSGHTYLGDKQKQRSERASSLALPHNSLLDFYDKQQEQCNFVALLPENANMVVRRHSSHSYPMLEIADQHQQHEQHNHLSQPFFDISNEPKADRGTVSTVIDNVLRSKELHESFKEGNLQHFQSVYPQSSPETRALFVPQYQQRLKAQQKVKQLNFACTSNKALSKQSSELQRNENQKLNYQTTLNTPPPIPKRTFRNKFSWNSTSDEIPIRPLPEASITQTPTRGKHQNSTTSAFLRRHDMQQLPTTTGCHTNTSPGSEIGSKENNGISSPLHADVRSHYSEGISQNYGSGYDTSGASDDEHMSLENSVFEESLNSTPVKFSANAQSKQLNSALAAKNLAALTGDVSNSLKRSNRSSSSTVDSSIMSSGYGSSSHSERFASTSTTADFRSRFSSVDTQSSLDSCLTERTAAESPSTREITFKTERPRVLANEVLYTLNNNEINADFLTHEYNAIASNNNNGCTFNTQLQVNKANSVPSVPVRRGQRKNVQMNFSEPLQFQSQSRSQQSLNNSIGSSNKACSTVPNSTSTSSTASAGSSISTGSSMSISASASGSGSGNSSLAAQTQQPHVPQQKRPPIPPARGQVFQVQDSANTKPCMSPQVSLTVRDQLNRSKRPPPIQNQKIHQRQDSSLSSDSFSATLSPGYNTTNPAGSPPQQNSARSNKNIVVRQAGSTKAGNTGPVIPPRNKFNFRQDSTISSDSFSQTFSPGYSAKIMEVPLLPSLSGKRLCNASTPINIKQKFQADTTDDLKNSVPMSPIPKCVSTPARLQTIVRIQNNAPNTMSLSHQIISRRKSSNPYITNGRLKFRLFQILINALALMAIAGGLAAYFNAYPTIKFVNKTIINTVHIEDPLNYGKNPAPGTCLPIIVKFCQGPQIPYNFTVFPNYIGHFGQLETQVDMDAYEALVDVRCYELVSLFLCTLFVPKCGNTGATVPPCKSLCTETMRRCGFFFDVFGLSLPEYLNCKLFKDFESPDDCVGLEQVQNVMIASANPKCDGFLCDNNRCLPQEYVCDGNLDCMDHADEKTCQMCPKDQLFCGNGKCITTDHICNGVFDCPFGQDEKNCIRLSERNGDLGKGILEVFRMNTTTWTPACVKNWDRAVSPSAVCSMLGYSAVNATSVITQKTHRPLLTSVNVSTDIWKMYSKKKFNLMKEFSNCTPDEDYPIAELTCSNFECGKVKKIRRRLSSRIIGGAKAHPGSWPFLAAILGGPEKIFYCAGVLISDQWVLTASHCIGNHTIIDLEDWTIQLGVTRRNSYTYSSQEVKVKTVIPHPLYNTAITHDNDIALFQLAKRVAFHEHLLPVCLPPPNMKQLKPDAMCTVIGWGKRRDKDPTATYEPIVNEVQVPIIRRQQCDEWLDNLTVSDGMLCAGYEEGGKDACQGDSGGPLLCPYPGEKDKWFVAGIVSWGIMCAHPKLPGVYANVIKYLPWINEQIQKYSREESYSKYDAHPGGPDVLSNLATVSLKSSKHAYKSNKRSPMDIDYYESEEKKSHTEYTTSIV